MENLIFAIDCDEVLRQTLDHMLDLYNKHFDTKKTRSDITDFKCENSFPEIQEATGMTASQWFFQEHGEELFLNTEPFPYIKEDIETLRKYGKVIILTYQKSYANKIQTLQWLEKHGIECDGVCFLKDKTLLTADYLIDDNDWNFSGSNVKHGILINAPYNMGKSTEDIRKTTNGCETMDRFESLHEFVEKFVSLQKQIEKAKKEYPINKMRVFELKSSVPYTDSTIHKQTWQFSRAGEKVFIANYWISGVRAYARLKLLEGWGDVKVDINDLNKYLNGLQ